MNLKKRRIIAGFGALGVAITLAVIGSTTTGAYLSDSTPGTIQGTIGTIKISSPDTVLNYDRLLPGTPQTVSTTYTNTGNSPQDVWVVFNNPDALHAFNNRGTYAEFHVSANGVHVFDSANLNDNSGGTCGPLSPSGCWPVPRAIKLASNLAPGATGNVGFTFGYASKMTTPEAGFNPYPLAAPTASGLPYLIWAGQLGQTP